MASTIRDVFGECMCDQMRYFNITAEALEKFLDTECVSHPAPRRWLCGLPPAHPPRRTASLSPHASPGRWFRGWRHGRR